MDSKQKASNSSRAKKNHFWSKIWFLPVKMVILSRKLAILVKNGLILVEIWSNFIIDFIVISRTFAAQNWDFAKKNSKFFKKIEILPEIRNFLKTHLSQVRRNIPSYLKCVQIGFYFQNFWKFPKIYFYFCVIIIFLLMQRQSFRGQWVNLFYSVLEEIQWLHSESRVIIRDGIMARAMNGAFSLAIDKYNSEDERR